MKRARAVITLAGGALLQALNVYAAFATYGMLAGISLCILGATLAVAATLSRRASCSSGE